MRKILRLAPRDWIGLAIVLMGFVLRLRQYLANRSLWLDEVMLALNIVSRSFMGLTEGLDYDQQAPIGFLWLQKTAVLAFSSSEYALRLVPFIAGCLALWLMYLLTRRYPSISGNTALGLFAISSKLIYYSSENKQYMVDVAIALGVLLITLSFESREKRARDYLIMGGIGAVLIWFSHPLVFTLAGLGLIIFVKAMKAKSTRELFWTILTGAMWLGSFWVSYQFFLYRPMNSNFLLDFWGGNFMPLDSTVWSWLIHAARNYVLTTIGLEIPRLMGAVIALLGLILLIWRDRWMAAMLVLPILFALGASAFHAYPFTGRMLLFTAPAFFILVGEVVEIPIRFFHGPAPVFRWLSGFIALTLVLINSQTTVLDFISPKYEEHIKPTMEYLRDNREPNDLIFVNHYAEPAVHFYASKYGFSASDFIISGEHRDQPDLYCSEVDDLRGHGRVWFIFSRVYEEGFVKERDSILGYLDTIGNQTREIGFPGTLVYLYLYDLSTP